MRYFVEGLKVAGLTAARLVYVAGCSGWGARLLDGYLVTQSYLSFPDQAFIMNPIGALSSIYLYFAGFSLSHKSLEYLNIHPTRSQTEVS